MTDSLTNSRDTDEPYRPPQSAIGEMSEVGPSIPRLARWQWCLWGLLAAIALVRLGDTTKSMVFDRQALTLEFAIRQLLPALLATAGALLVLVRPAATFLLGVIFYLIQSITYMGPEGLWLTRSYSRVGFDIVLSETRALRVNAVPLFLLCCHAAAFVKARGIKRT